MSTCSPVTSSISVWNVSIGWAWFSDSQMAFRFRLVSDKGRYWRLETKKRIRKDQLGTTWSFYRLPDTSRTWSSLQSPSSLGRKWSLFSRKDKTLRHTKWPTSTGSSWSRLRSTLRLVNLVMLPMEVGSSVRKFSVRMSSCRATHLTYQKNMKPPDVIIETSNYSLSNGIVERRQSILVHL